jgi:peptidoglycan-associated lipoprotein
MIRLSSKAMAVGALAAALTTGCATRGQLRKAVQQQRVALDTERSARVAADSGIQGDVTTVKADVQTLRNEVEGLRTELQGLRGEFGAKITMLEEGVRFALPVHFGFDDASVRDNDRAALDRFAQVVQHYYPSSAITVEGFADPAGTASYNAALSRRRADGVRDYLASKGLADSQLRSIGYGETRLVAPGASRDDPGAEANRRVVFVVETGGDTPAGRLTAEAFSGTP